MIQPLIKQQGLFDNFGRRIPYQGMRVHPLAPRRYFQLIQQELDLSQIYKNSMRFIGLGNFPITAQQFEEVCNTILENLCADSELADLARGIHVPFLCPPIPAGIGRVEDLRQFVKAAERSLTTQYPPYPFRNRAEEKGKPGETLKLASGTRYEHFEEARTKGAVVGWYFPNCLAGYDIASQRRQMESLPESVAGRGFEARIVLSGGVEAAAALVGCPLLLYNEEHYPHHLCLSALEDPDERYFYSFEAYGCYLLVFEYRTNVLIPGVTQVSEQFAGGLTVFAAVR